MSDIEDEYELTFDISLAKQRSSLPIFLGGLVLGLFILALLLTFIHLRNYSAVTELTEPGKDGSVHEYLIVFTTSLLPGSGMIGDGKVSVKLIGSFSDSEFFTLHQRMIEQNILARGHTDIFVIHTPVDLGDIRRMILTITNWSSGTLLTWRPCFLKIIKSDNFQCWGTSIKDILACETNIQYTFDLIKDNENEELSLWKMIILYHPWTSPFNHPQRFGAYTNTANGIFFFFTQSTLLITTLITFISSQIFTENMDSNFDISLVVSSAAITTSLLQILELFLRSIRPSDELSRGESWQGLWIPEFYKNPNYINIDFDWDKAVSHPSGVVDEPINIFTSLKMPTLESSSGSHHDSNSSSSSNSSEQEYEEEAYVVAMDLTPDLIEHCLLSVLHQISGIKTRYFSAANEKESILKYRPIFIGKNSLEGVKVKMLDVVRTSQNCQFCIWMDNPYMGEKQPFLVLSEFPGSLIVDH